MKSVLFLVAACASTLPIPLLALHGAADAQTGKMSNASTLRFDDVPALNGITPVPSPYSYLQFSSYNIFAPHDPALSDIISENDLNCAVSAPNALIGSRGNHANSSDMASFRVANASSMAEDGLYPYFTLLSLQVKPMDAPPPGTTITFKGYSHEHDDADFQWHVDFISGYHLPLLVKMQEFSGEAWDKLIMVDVTADFGKGALDWEFCLDDLELQFFEKSGDGRDGLLIAQKVLDMNGQGPKY